MAVRTSENGESRELSTRRCWRRIRVVTAMTAKAYSSTLPVLRSAAVFFLIINLLAAAEIFRNRLRFFGKDPDDRHYYERQL